MFLQNELLISYKNQKQCVIPEEKILTASDDDLRDLLLKADFILLGGIGFSGLDQHYNANLGLYRSTVTSLQKDKELTQQFNNVYEKVLRCAEDIRVIVLTHTPVSNWTEKPCNPNWIYVNGHTHQNSLIRNEDGTTVLSDNQLGYKPLKWKLKSFKISGQYDPFIKMEDGIHQITLEMYRDFNYNRGIRSRGCNCSGKIFALKRNGLYMFLLQSNSKLYLLEGGQRKTLYSQNINYYYNNMVKYAQKIQDALSPYQTMLYIISKEIKSIGGCGIIHGCIVDIDFYNHIYLNPFDGKIIPYYALNTGTHHVYDDLPSLLKDKIPRLVGRFENAHKRGSVPILSQYAVTEKNQALKTTPATIPKIISGSFIYQPSNTIKSMQYILEKGVIRIWDKKILSAKFDKNPLFLPVEDKDK